ncbi:phage tail tube protein [Alicyclobacillus sp. ALC3]|uniref:phage tail tube protein n=1 Tax=Alicyclobacillus sp. ALC3 TaxID=2796143 RepID=UPI0023787C4C|nr:phage tail tube protein [Alicyclobacillus sp. ALC3]WDL96946.1 hypothetical protein JC200_22150 [Alicyclobacillus sp. ALC3]
MPAKLTSLSYLGLAVEATLGTPVAPTGFIPVKSFKPQDTPQYVADQGYRGQPVKVFGEYLGTMSSTYEIDGDAYPSSFGSILGAIFGGETVTGTTQPYTHTFKVAATPGSLTLSDYYVAGFRQWAGAKCDKLTVKFTPDAGLTYTAHFIGFGSVTGTAPVSQTFGTSPFFLGWEAALNIDGTANVKLDSFSVDIARAGSKALFSAANSQTPWDIFVGEMTADWDLSFYMEDDSEYTYALAEGKHIVSVTLTQPSTNYTCNFTSSAVQWTKPTIDRGKEFVAVSISGSAVNNATDSGVITAALTNDTSTAQTTTAAS